MIVFPVEAGHILCFARAIGDANPIYSDPEYAAQQEVGGVIAPPTFVKASAQFDPDYPLRPKPGEAWFGSGGTPSGRGPEGSEAPGLHAEEHYEYHRPVRAGEVLTVTAKAGETWVKVGRRGGKLTFTSLINDYRAADGELVVTARTVVVRAERPVDPGAN